MDLEELTWTPSISFQPNSLELLTCYVPSSLKTLFSKSNPKGGKSQISDAGDDGGDDGQTLKSRSRPLPTHPGMKYFRKGNPRYCYIPKKGG